MKRLLLLFMTLGLLAGCSTKKNIEQQLNRGQYDQALTNALRQLQSKKTDKRKSKFISLLKESYDRVTKRDLEDIAFLKKDNNPENSVRIFEMYSTLDARQRAIEPLLPLYLNGREVKFKFYDYTDDMIYYKNKTSEYLYDNAINLLKSSNKYDFRKAYDNLAYINKYNPNYKDIQQLMQEAHILGTDFVIVNIKNHTNQVIPKLLEDDLLNFDTYGLSNFWVEYHAQATDQIQYDYAMDLEMRQINISPERINERQLLREREIVDGWEYLLDSNGNVAKDSLGNDIKVDKIVNVRARLFEIQQHKAVQILGQVQFTDLQNNRLLDTFPIDSGFVFENWFARFNGDKRALTRDDLDLTNNRQIPFPSNEQMVFDAGEDLKQRLKQIINRQQF